MASEDTRGSRPYPIQADISPTGVTWLLVGLDNVPDGRTSMLLEMRDERCRSWTLRFDVKTPPKGRLEVKILSDDPDDATFPAGTPVPAMVRLVSRTTGRVRVPSNAIDLTSQFDGQGRAQARRSAQLPGRLRGDYWCVPAPFDMALPPGDWEITIRRGVEHIPITDTVSIKSNAVYEKSYRVKRWVDLRELGWYSGDDHVHCQILSQNDAEGLMAWVEAEDIHLANVVKMGDINRTWFEQRGFGPKYRVQHGDYLLSPGQEGPRTHDQLGRTRFR